ncbi:MAG: tetratricopeptide repeat protein [Gemmatimonadetes bacterium]|nr:tetratricopeptide repeat protein [Gemmatimonadota bacterium]
MSGPLVPPPPPGLVAPTSIETLAPGARLGSRYEIDSILGVGGMGVVYRARDLTLERDVALKVIRPDMANQPGAMERFRREIQLASKVTHKNILRIHDLGEIDGLSYISMNFVEGETLKQLMKREKVVPVDRSVSLAVQFCEALHAAYEVGVVHRDLKPANILLDEDGVPYIADFGLSRSMETGQTMTAAGTILGTIDYMSPEQARGETPDHRGDIYSLGIILYQMLTGNLPFQADTALSVMMKRVHQDAPKLSKERKVPPWLSGIVSRALKRDPDDRYQTAGEMARDLEAHQASRSFRALRRPRTLAGIGWGLIAALAILGAVLGTRFFLQRSPAEPATTMVTPKATLIILPFSNGTGDSDFDWITTGLPDLLRTDMQQFKTLRLVGQERVNGLLDGLRVGNRGTFRTDELQRISSLLGAENMLTAKLLKAGAQFRIEANLQRAVGGSVVAGDPLRVEGAGEESLFAMVDELSSQIRDALGVSRGWGESDQGVTELSTASVAALRLYQEGLALAREGNNLEAAERLEAALEADGDFGIARALLAETYDLLGYSQKAIEAADLAAEGIPRASPYEAARIQAVRARLNNDLEAAEQAYKSLLEITPTLAENHFDLASVQEDLGDLDAALASLQRVVELDPKHPNGHYVLGRVQVKLGNPSEALNSFNTALGLHVEINNDEGRATALHGLGFAYDDLGRSEEAMDYFQQSLEIRQRIGDRRGVGMALNNISVILLKRGQYEDAIDAVQRGMAIGDEIGDQAGNADRYFNLGEIYQTMGRQDEALQSYHESLKLVRELDDAVGLAWNLSSIGYANAVLGKYLEAYFFFKDALEKRREIGDKTDIIRSLIDISFVEQIQGRYDEALKFILEGMKLAREVGHQPGITVFSLNLANIHEDQGNFDSALATLDEALSRAGGTGADDQVATGKAYLGSVRRRLGDHEGADEALREALDLARSMDLGELIPEILSYQAALLTARGEKEAAIAVAREAVDAAERIHNHRLTLLARLHAAEARGSLADVEAARQLAESSGLEPLVSQAHLALARLHLEAGRGARAVEEADNAIASGTPLQERDVLFQAHYIAARGHEAQGNTRDALEHYTGALDLLEEMLQDLDGEPLGHFLARRETVEFARHSEQAFGALPGSELTERLRAVLEL